MERRSAKSRHQDHPRRGDRLTDVPEQIQPTIQWRKAVGDDDAKRVLRQQRSGLCCTQHGLRIDLLYAARGAGLTRDGQVISPA
jgi:hypothetical protein